MPQITITLTADQGRRVQEALAATDYPPTLAGYKALLVDYTRTLVRDHERGEAERIALAAVAPPADLTVG